ncbi:MAG: type II secretion system F family protein [Patescibacteria group bacterium UBA2103]
MKKASSEKKRIIASLKNAGLQDAVYLFFDELTALMRAGITVTRAVGSIKESTPSRRLRKILGRVEQSLIEGATLSEALSAEYIINPRIKTLLDVGERSGNLIANLEAITLQNEKEVLFRGAVRSSLLYVVIVMTVSLGVGIATPWIILPQLTAFFSTFDADLPGITLFLIGTGQFFTDYGVFVFPALAVFLILILYFLFSFPKTRFIGHSVLFHLPLSHRLIKEAEIARFSYLLGTQLRAGISIMDALEVMPSTTTYANYRRFYMTVLDRVKEGYSFSEAVLYADPKKKLLSSSVVQLVSAGEQSGSLSDMLLKVGETYENRVQQTAKSIPTLLEPIMLVLVGAIVAVIALGVVLPVYNLSEIIK